MPPTVMMAKGKLRAAWRRMVFKLIDMMTQVAQAALDPRP